MNPISRYAMGCIFREKPCRSDTMMPPLVTRVAKMQRAKDKGANTTFHTLCIPRRSSIIAVWRNAVPVSQGIREAFSTGSQAQ